MHIGAVSYRGTRRGFTLIELLVVIAIIALLLSLLTPSLQQAKALAVRAHCQSTQRNLLLATRQYLANFDQQFPSAAPFWCYSPDNPGPEGAWFTRSKYDDIREGIGDYLEKEGGDLHCSAAEKHEDLYSWGVPADLPTFVPNRTIIPYAVGANYHRCAQRLNRISKPQRTFVFADGNWRGVFQAFSLSYDAKYASEFKHDRFFWTPHMDGTNVGYLDAHVEWVHSSRNIHPDDWSPPHYGPMLDWCEMTNWAIMWR